jgi:hypothetical protein
MEMQAFALGSLLAGINFREDIVYESKLSSTYLCKNLLG